MNICGDCKRYMACSWERDFIPVPGWTARPARVMVQKGQYVDTFEVTACPMFLPPYSDYPAHPVDNAKPRPIRAVHTETGEVRRYESIGEVERDGFLPSQVRRVLYGGKKSYKNWKFFDDA